MTDSKSDFNLGVFLIKVLTITIGAAIMALGLELMLVPNSIIDGGITGISMILSEITGIQLSVFIFILNIPFIILAWKILGKTFALSALYGIIVLSLLTNVFHEFNPLVDDVFLASVFGGIFLGAGVGLVMRGGGCLDGTEVLAILANRKFPTLSVGQVVMFINLVIFSGAASVFGWKNAMYSMVAYFVAYKVIDIVVEGLDQSKTMWIISDHHAEIQQAFYDELGRGVTYFKGESAANGNDRKIILAVINRLEETKARQIVRRYDKNPFVVMGNAADVKGGNFGKKKH